MQTAARARGVAGESDGRTRGGVQDLTIALEAARKVPHRRFKLTSPRFLFSDPFISPRFQQIQRQSPAIDHLIVKSPYVELRAQFLLRTLAQLTDLQLPQLVTKRLRRPGNIPIRLRLNCRFIHGARLAEKL